MNRLSRLSLEGFKSIRALELELGALNVLIGPNGAGKSNLLSFLRMLNALSQGRLSRFVLQEGGADMILHHGRKRTPEIRARIVFEDGQAEASYAVTLGAAPPDSFFLEDEALTWKPAAGPPRTLSADAKKAVAFSLLAQSTGADEQALARMVGGITHYHFHDTSAEGPIRQPCQIDDNRVLRDNGGNLAAFLYLLQRTRPEHYQSIRDTIRLATPFFDDFVLAPKALDPKTIQIEWRERGSDMVFFAHHLSDGTLRFIALATALLQPELPLIFALDEPELGLHPYAVTLLASLVRSASRNHQIIVATQSVTLLDELAEPDEVIVVERRASEGAGSESVFRRLDPEALRGWLNEYTLGELWEKNVLGGAALKRVLVLVEGQTEETFVHRVLAPHLWGFDKAPEVTRVATKQVQGRRAFRGGIPVFAKVLGDVRRLLGSNPTAVTTLFDYYALPDDFPGLASLPAGATCFERAAHLEQAFAARVGDPRFIPNLVLHEFEGLLFAEPAAIASVLLDEASTIELAAIASAHASPEEIDEGPDTHPSRRIQRVVPGYQKPLHGPQIAERIGVATIRARCRHFDAWLGRLEIL